MRISLLLLGLIFLSGCASSGYNPHYIVSDATEETLTEPNLRED